jgi:hypothetical protein
MRGCDSAMIKKIEGMDVNKAITNSTTSLSAKTFQLPDASNMDLVLTPIQHLILNIKRSNMVSKYFPFTII